MPKSPECWPDDPNYPDGYTEIDSPSGIDADGAAYFDTELLDSTGQSMSRGPLDVAEPFRVRFRVALQPREYWTTASGTWSFDLAFNPIGEGSGFSLSQLLGSSKLKMEGWSGEDTRCLELIVQIPPNTLPESSAFHNTTATVRLQPTNSETRPLWGSSSLGSYVLQAETLRERRQQGGQVREPFGAAVQEDKEAAGEELSEARDLDLDEDELFHRLSPSSREAFERADGLRQALGQDRVHMEHLVVGLFQKRGGPAQLVFADAGIDATALRELIARASKEEIDPSTHYDSTRLTVLPVISRHVREALIAASSAAGPDASSPIRSRHLLYGVLSVTDCELVKALAQRRGITRASVELDYPEPSTAGVEAAAEPDVTLPFVPSFPGFAGDLPSDEDHLGFKGDVEAFARLLAAKQVAPPLSVGLFGDWGTGKSTFMGLLRTRIREIAGQAAMAEQERRTDRSLPRPDCCANVRQITFNAWHYVDVNLWASLVTRIFEGLAEPEEDDPNATKQQQEQQREQREQQRREIFKQLDTAKELEQEATRRRDDAEQQLRQATEQLRSLERHRQSEEQALQERAATDLSPPDVGDLVAGAQAAATAAGLPDVPATIEGLQRQADRLRFIGDRVELAWQQARIAPRTRRVLNMAIVLAVLLFLTGLGLLVAGLLPGLPVLVASIVPIASAWITAIGKALRRVDLASARVEQALRDAEQRRLQAAREDAQRRAAAEARLQASIERLRQDEARQREEASRARRQRDTALRELEDIQAGRRLFRYIADRARGAEYRRYLGVIALIRRDFAQLSRLLQEAAQEGAERAGPGKPGDARQVESVKASADTVPGAESVELAAGETRGSLPAIDRIILYIDDLDRCPAERVVEVLEAVHLILALPLFIVVVGVDSRWLLTSLHRHYQAQLGSGDRQVPPRTEAEEKEVPLAAGLWQDEWASTPQNYLEKIFQIPFAIRPMDRTGFRELLKHVLGDQASDDNEREQTDPSSHNVLTQALPEQQPPPQQSTTSGETRPSHQPGGPGQPSEATHSTTPPPEQHAQDERAGEQREPGGRAAEPDLGEPVAMNPQGLRVTTEELEFMAGLARMVQTPRAAKRLLNTYRLIRAGLDEADLHEFVHNGGASGQYQVALILLAVLIGFPELAGTLFDELLISRAASWEDFLGEERAKFHERRGRRAPRPPTCGRWSPSSQHQTARPAVRGRASVL